MNSKRFGIVFGGGGAKGSWQIGVWKALAEHGFYASAVSGTSVGALNAALYSAFGKKKDGWEQGLQAWKTISPQSILPKNYRIVEKLFNRFPSLRNFGLFGSDGIETLINKFFKLSDFERNSYLPIFITAHCQDDNACEYFNLFSPQKAYSRDEIKQILLASTAIPYIFDPQKIRGKFYSDGGFDLWGNLTDDIISTQMVDNCPVAPLLDPRNCLHLDMVFALPLNMDEILKYQHESINGIPVIPIMPSQDLGSCLNFDPRKVKDKLDLGYRDAQKVLGMLDEQNRISEIQKDAINLAYKAAWDLNRLQNEQSCEFDETFLLSDILKEIEKCDDEEELSFIADTFPLPSTEEMLKFRTQILKKHAEIQLIDDGIQHIISNANPKEIQDWYIQAHSFLSGIESGAKARDRQNLFQRFFHSISGRNSEEINKALQNLTNTNYCLLKLIVELQRFQTEQELQVGDLYNQIVTDEKLHQLSSVKNAFSNMLLTRNVIRLACQIRLRQMKTDRTLTKLDDRISIGEWQDQYWGDHRIHELMNNTPRYRFCMIMLDYYRQFYFSENYDSLRAVIAKCGIHELNDLKEPLTDKERENLSYECAADFSIEKEIRKISSEKILPDTFLTDWAIKNIDQLICRLFEQWKQSQFRPFDSLHTGMKGRFFRYISELEDILQEETYFHSYNKKLKELKARISNYRLMIYMLGEFNSGKSSILNRWLGYGAQCLPETPTPETAVLLKFQYAESFSDQKLIVTTWAGEKECITLGKLSAKDIAQIITRCKQKDYFEMALCLHNPRMKYLQNNEVELADMPGYAAGNPVHEKQLYLRIMDKKETFGFIFCTHQDSKQCLTNGDVKFLQKIDLSRPNEIPYCFLLMRAGEMNPEERRKKIDELSRKVSDIRKSKPLYSGFTDRNKEGGIEGLEQSLMKIINQKDHQIFIAFQKEFQSFCGNLIKELDLRSSCCVSGNALDEKRRELEKTQDWLNKNCSKIQAELHNLVSADTEDLLDSIKRELSCYDSAQEMLASFNRIVKRCINQAVECKYYKIQNRFQGELRLGILNCNSCEVELPNIPEVEMKGSPGWGWHILFMYDYMKAKYKEDDRKKELDALCKFLDKNKDRVQNVFRERVDEIIELMKSSAEQKIQLLQNNCELFQREKAHQDGQKEIFERKKAKVNKILGDIEHE